MVTTVITHKVVYSISSFTIMSENFSDCYNILKPLFLTTT